MNNKNAANSIMLRMDAYKRKSMPLVLNLVTPSAT